MKIVIHGQTPAQKNGKDVGVSKSTGRTFVASNPRVKAWQKTALKELEQYELRFRPQGRLQINYMFYVKDNVQRDTDNMLASCNDMLQRACSDMKPVVNKKGKTVMKPVKGTGMIVGDHWQVLKIGSADAAIDKENPRAVLTISEI